MPPQHQSRTFPARSVSIENTPYQKDSLETEADDVTGGSCCQVSSEDLSHGQVYASKQQVLRFHISHPLLCH